MVQYYYDKYTAIANTVYVDSSPWVTASVSAYAFSGYAKSYSYNTQANTYHESATIWGAADAIQTGDVCYLVSGGLLYKIVAQYPSTANAAIPSQTYYKDKTSNTTSTYYSRGALVKSNIPAEEGTYPANGRHSDGYWYVKGAAVPVNTAGMKLKKSILIKQYTNNSYYNGEVITIDCTNAVLGDLIILYGVSDYQFIQTGKLSGFERIEEHPTYHGRSIFIKQVTAAEAGKKITSTISGGSSGSAAALEIVFLLYEQTSYWGKKEVNFNANRTGDLKMDFDITTKFSVLFFATNPQATGGTDASLYIPNNYNRSVALNISWMYSGGYDFGPRLGASIPYSKLNWNNQGNDVKIPYLVLVPFNNKPTLSLSLPTNNQRLYENDTINISGDAYDADKDQSVTAYYQINNEARKVLATNLSQTQISLSKQLTFKGGKLYDGETALTGTLTDGVAHTLKVWAEDSEKSSSAIAERTFYVVPNRAPLLTVDAVVPSGVVDADKFKISGTASDQDANSTVTVTRRINAGNAVEIYNGAGGAWEFDLALSQLVVGQNTIVIEVVDNYGAKTSKTVTLNKKAIKTPILQSVARYKIEPPKGSAMGVLLFIQRDEELDIKVELSMTLNGEQEQYETLTPANTAPVQQGIVEDTFEYEGLEAKQNIILKITPSRTDLSFNHKIHLISGAVD
ncbi:hypothetical protein [Lysinibacillus sp. 38-6]|uniref:hypothetical protein n=1 Tax=Lysinibacillus sp. 38-6 TaxID=3385991 RepID=UPI003908A201